MQRLPALGQVYMSWVLSNRRGPHEAGHAGRRRHGLWTKYVDACRVSRALTGDYSPRTGGEFAQAALVVQPVSAASRTIDTKTVGVRQCLAVAQVSLDQRRIAQERIGHQTHFTAR